MTTTETSTTLTIGSKKTAPDHPVRFSFLQVFEAKLPKNPKPGDKPKHSVQVIVDKKSPDVPLIHASMKAAHAADKKIRGLDYEALDLILRDGDNPKDNKKKHEHLKGCYFFNASCGAEYPPEVVGTHKDANTGKLVRLTPKEIKSGDYGAVTVNFYGYDINGNQGISAGLRNLQKRKTGESLANVSNADDDFEAEEDDDLLNG